MSLTDEPYIIIDATLVRRTGKAFLLRRISDDEEFWVPQSCAEWQKADTWAIAKWWADKNGVEA
jgi:hypothetical protein